MPEKLLERRIAELDVNGSADLAVSDDKEKRTYSIEEIQQILAFIVIRNYLNLTSSADSL